MDPSILKTIENEYIENEYKVKIISPEFTCLCPDKRDQPDFATIYITYIPNRKLIELKSLKYYFVNFRDKEIYHEEATNQILKDLVTVLKPRYMKIKGDWNVRGGIKTIVETNYVSEEWEGNPKNVNIKHKENTVFQ